MYLSFLLLGGGRLPRLGLLGLLARKMV